MRYIISGGRDYKNKYLVFDILKKLNPEWLSFGDCPTGVDKFVFEWCKDNKFDAYSCYYADWEKEGKKAGPLRNREMCQTNPDSILIAFPGGKGTASCIKEAELLNIPILVVKDE